MSLFYLLWVHQLSPQNPSDIITSQRPYLIIPLPWLFLLPRIYFEAMNTVIQRTCRERQGVPATVTHKFKDMQLQRGTESLDPVWPSLPAVGFREIGIWAPASLLEVLCSPERGDAGITTNQWPDENTTNARFSASGPHVDLMSLLWSRPTEIKRKTRNFLPQERMKESEHGSPLKIRKWLERDITTSDTFNRIFSYHLEVNKKRVNYQFTLDKGT